MFMDILTHFFNGENPIILIYVTLLQLLLVSLSLEFDL